MRNKTWVALFFVLAGLVVGFVLGLALATIFATLRVTDTALLGDKVTLSRLLGLAIGAVLAFGFYSWAKSKTFVTNSVDELNKVNWPTWAETKMNTLVVIATSVIAALILGVFDITFGWASNWLAANF